MFCKNCGNQIDDTAAFCPNCGTKNEGTAAPEAPAYEAPAAPAPEAPAYEAPVAPEAPAPKKKGFKKWLLAIIIPAAVIVIALILILCFAGGGKGQLQDELMEGGTWIRADEEYDALLLELTFSEDTIEYAASGIYVDLREVVAEIPYEVVDEDTILLTEWDREVDVTVEYDPSDGTRTLTCTPALTSTDSIEWWFQFED